ncbi:nucleotidyltransferase domain-containing protein [Breznakiellaceae bacterium SP9]
MEIEPVLNELVRNLKPADPLRIILFGSYAKGCAREDSDIDLMVILDSDEVAMNYTARMDRFLSVERLIRDIHGKFAMDILVYSKKELVLIKNNGNDFLAEVEQTGRVLYEKTS